MSESTYTVRPGDSLSKIARANGTTTDELAKINGITNIDIIRVGQHLKLREPEAAVSTPPEPSSSTGDDGGSNR